MRKFGIRMEGCEEGIEAIIRERMVDQTSEFFRYLEIGVASGETLRSVSEICREAVASNAAGWKRWATVGIDLPPGDAWALDLNSVRALMPDIEIRGNPKSEIRNPSELEALVPGVPMTYGRPNLWLARSTEVLREVWAFHWDLDVALIDGCHGKACVKADFQGVEGYVMKGGYVIFHDAGVADQGGDYQPHCREHINVRAALEELGLLGAGSGERGAGSGERGERKGWRFVREIKGDKARGGNSCVVVQKV